MKKKILLLAGAVLLLIACCTFAGCVGDQSASSNDGPIVGAYVYGFSNGNKNIIEFHQDGTFDMVVANADNTKVYKNTFRYENLGNNIYGFSEAKFKLSDDRKSISFVGDTGIVTTYKYVKSYVVPTAKAS